MSPARDALEAVHRRDRRGYSWFHAPGYLVAVAAADVPGFERALAEGPGADTGVEARALLASAGAAVERVQAPPPYDPVCLTLYLGNRCNLTCSYCYADPGAFRESRLDWPQIRAAATAVAARCAARGLPLVTVFHGGGEPTLYRDLIDRSLPRLRRVAASAGVPLFTHVATNGVMPAAQASWLAERFDSVSLSCDGPEPVQTRQRPTPDGGATTAAVERTAAIVTSAGTRLEVRATITPATIDRQPEIVDYLCRALNPAEIHVEPVYRAGRAAAERWRTAEAAAFVTGFLAARVVGAGFGVPVRTSIARPGEPHGTYCNLNRDVLQVVPGGVVSGCFLAHDTLTTVRSRTGIGVSSRAGLELDASRIAALRSREPHRPDACRTCVNRYHCTLGCPDACPYDPDPAVGGFRCAVAKRLTTALLDAAAEALWQRAGRTGLSGARLDPDGAIAEEWNR